VCGGLVGGGPIRSCLSRGGGSCRPPPPVFFFLPLPCMGRGAARRGGGGGGGAGGGGFWGGFPSFFSHSKPHPLPKFSPPLGPYSAFTALLPVEFHPWSSRACAAPPSLAPPPTVFITDPPPARRCTSSPPPSTCHYTFTVDPPLCSPLIIPSDPSMSVQANVPVLPLVLAPSASTSLIDLIRAFNAAVAPRFRGRLPIIRVIFILFPPSDFFSFESNPIPPPPDFSFASLSSELPRLRQGPKPPPVQTSHYFVLPFFLAHVPLYFSPPFSPKSLPISAPLRLSR